MLVTSDYLMRRWPPRHLYIDLLSPDIAKRCGRYDQSKLMTQLEKMMKALIGYTLAAAMAAASVGVSAKSGPAYDGEGPRGDCPYAQKGPSTKIERALKGLDLTQAQQDQIKGLLEQARQQQGDKGRVDPAQKQKQRDERQALMSQETFDEAAARAMIASHQTLSTERKVAQMKVLHGVLQQLTDEQKAVFQDRMSRQMKRMQDHRGRG